MREIKFKIFREKEVRQMMKEEIKKELSRINPEMDKLRNKLIDLEKII